MQGEGARGTSAHSGTEELVSGWDANALGPDERPPFEQAGELHGHVVGGWGPGGRRRVVTFSTRAGV